MLGAAALEVDPPKLPGLGSATLQNITASIQISPSLLGRAAGDLFHPLLIRMSGDPRHTDPAAFQMKEEQHIVGHQTPPAQYFHGEEVSAGQDIQIGRASCRERV